MGPKPSLLKPVGPEEETPEHPPKVRMETASEGVDAGTLRAIRLMSIARGKNLCPATCGAAKAG